MERRIPNLLPDTRYVFRVRAKDAFGNLSDWSEALDVLTSTDTTIPLPPTNLLVDFSSPDLVISWTGATQNDDGSALRDFQYYEVRIIDGGVEKVYATSQTTFVYTLAQNRNDWTVPRPSFIVEVRTTDVLGHVSEPLEGTATNAIPPNPTVPPDLATGFTLIGVTMTAPPINDLGGFDLYHSTTLNGTYTLVAQTLGNHYAHEVSEATEHFYKFKVRDVFEQASLGFSPPASTTTFVAYEPDEEPPADVAGFIATPGIDDQTQMPFINVQWNANVDDDMDRYDVRIRKAGDVLFRTVSTGVGTTGYKFVDLHPEKDYELQIRPIDITGNTGNWIPSSPLTITTGSGTIAWDPDAEGVLILEDPAEIRSESFVPGLAGWRISELGFELNEGTVRAPAIQIGISNENLLVNSSFENGTVVASGWSIYPGGNSHAYTVDNTQTRYQSKSQKIVAAGGADLGVQQTVTFAEAYEAETWMTASIWVRQSSGTAWDVRCRIIDNTNGQTYTGNAVAAGVGGWKRFSFSKLMPDAFSSVTVVFFVVLPTTGQTFHFDGAMLTNASYNVDYSPRTLEIPDNYIVSAYISDLTADKISSGSIQSAVIQVSATGYIQSFDYDGNSGYRLEDDKLTFQNGGIEILGINAAGAFGGLTLDSSSFRAVYGGLTKFVIKETGVFLGGDTTANANVYFDGSKTVFQDTSGAYDFIIDTSEANILRLTNGVTDSFRLNKDGTAYFAGNIAGSTIDIGGSDATSFHVDINGNIWSGDAAFVTAPFKVDNSGNLTAASITGENIIGNSSANSLRSGDYNAGVAGWAILGNGDVEFNEGTFRGSLAAASGTFVGTVSGGSIDIGGADATSFHVDTSGNMWLGHANYASAPFKISAAGDLTATSGTFSGTLSGAGGTLGTITSGTISGVGISGATITGGTITGSTFQTAVSGARTIIGPGLGGVDQFIVVYNTSNVIVGFIGYASSNDRFLIASPTAGVEINNIWSTGAHITGIFTDAITTLTGGSIDVGTSFDLQGNHIFNTTSIATSNLNPNGGNIAFNASLYGPTHSVYANILFVEGGAKQVQYTVPNFGGPIPGWRYLIIPA